RALRMGDPHEEVAIDHCQPHELARLLRDAIEYRLTDVGNACRDVELLPNGRETHRQSIEAGFGILLRPAEIDQRRQQPMRATLGKLQTLRDLPERHVARAVGEQLDDREATLSRYVGHGLSLYAPRATARRVESGSNAACP